MSAKTSNNEDRLKSILQNIYTDKYNPKILTSILKIGEWISLDDNERLFEEGQPSDSLYLLIKGSLKAFKNKNDRLTYIGTVKQGEVIGEMGLISGDERFASIYSNKQSVLFKITKIQFESLMKEDSSFLYELTKQGIRRLHKTFQLSKLSVKTNDNEDRLRDILQRIYTDKYNPNILSSILKAGEWVLLSNNERLFEEGQPSDSLYFLIKGSLKAFKNNNDRLIYIGTVKQGEVIGEMGLISGDKRSASIFSNRKSVLFKISKIQFESLMKEDSSFLYELTKQVIRRLHKTLDSDKGQKSTKIFTLINLNIEDNNNTIGVKIGRNLKNALENTSKTYFLDPVKVSKLLTDSHVNADSGESNLHQLEELIYKLEEDYEFLILLCDGSETNWTYLCYEAADKILYLHESKNEISNLELLRQIDSIQYESPDHLKIEQQLIIIHENKDTPPTNTEVLLEKLKPISFHHHIEKNNHNDFGRIARHLTGNSVGVAFGGGGARGIAHIGVYKALIELDIPVDVVCGTSAGGIAAGGVASNFSIEKMINHFKNPLGQEMFKEYGLPFSSLVKTTKVVEYTKGYTGDRMIEDLWIPMFACSVNISSTELSVLDRGPLWRAIRATSALPGILLPVVINRELYVDGGISNNLPGDILIKKYSGKLISVNVSPEKDLFLNFDSFPNQNNLMMSKLLSKKGFKKKYGELNVPSLGNILMRSIMASSASTARKVAKMSDIFLDLPINDFGMMDFDKTDELVEIGYNYTIDYLSKVDLSNYK